MNKNFNSIAGHVSAVFTVCVWGTTFNCDEIAFKLFYRGGNYVLQISDCFYIIVFNVS